MVRLIVGRKGKGKTTEILSKVNQEIQTADGSIVYLDKSKKHMYELHNKVRLIDVSGYPLDNSDQFIGFICGIISQDHDLQSMYLDGFLKCAKLEEDHSEAVCQTILELDRISSMFHIDFYISLSMDQQELPEALQDKVIIAL